MWPHTSRLSTTLTAGGTVVTLAQILVDGELALSLDSTDPDFADLGGPVDGRVDVQRGTLRRTAEVTLLDVTRSMTMGQSRDLLVPLRSELRLWRGALYSDRTTEQAPDDRELLPVGTLVVVDVDESSWPALRVSLSDRAWFLSQHRFTSQYTVTSGTNLMAALADLLESRIPAGRLEYNLPTTDLTTGAQSWDEQGDPAEAAHDMAAAAGLQLYADPLGVFQAVPETDIVNDPVQLAYEEGPGSLLLMPAQKRTGANTVNAVVATGEAADLAAPVRGYAQDDDPDSPTYVGKLGVIPEFFSSPLLRTAQQADLAAQTRLRNVAGLSEATAVTALVHPGLESGDVIRVTSASRSIDTRLVVDAFSVPLRAAESQVLTCRAKVVT